MNEAGEAIRRFRERHGLSQREMGQAFGTSASNIGAWEGGVTRVSADAIGRIKSRFPDLWLQLADLKLREVQRELKVEGEGEHASHAAAIATLSELEKQIREARERLQSEES